MRAGQIIALLAALILLLPGLCFLTFGAGFTYDQFTRTGGHGGELDFDGLGPAELVIAALLLGLTAFLFRVAFRRPRPGAPADEPPG